MLVEMYSEWKEALRRHESTSSAEFGLYVIFLFASIIQVTLKEMFLCSFPSNADTFNHFFKAFSRSLQLHSVG